MINQNFSHLEEFTEKILLDKGLFSYPVAIVQLVDSLGIKRDEAELKSGVSGMAVVHGNTRIISVNRHQHEHRKRFTIGHELGHLFLDSGMPLNVDQNIYYRDGSSDWRELRANYFSAAMLMPKKLIEKFLSVENPARAFGDDEIQAIANAFNVSTQAMCLRLATLGLV